MNDDEYRKAMKKEQERVDAAKHDLDSAGKQHMDKITSDYKASKGGHGGAVAGVVIMIILGIAAWMYFG